MANPELEIRELGCVRGGRAVFDGLSLGVPAGCLLRVTGANGAGKTSLLRMVCGLLRPQRGEVLWRGANIGRLREAFHRQLIYLGHAAALKDGLSVSENLLAAAHLSGANPDALQVAAALDAVGLRNLERLLVRALSQGQRRRVALARLVIGNETPLWVLDEPFDALDIAAAAWLIQMISARVHGGGVVLLTCHQQNLEMPADLPQMELAL